VVDVKIQLINYYWCARNEVRIIKKTSDSPELLL